MNPIVCVPGLPVGVGVGLGVRLGVGLGLGVPVALVVGLGWVPPLHATPLSAKFVGAGLLLLFHEPLNPKFTVALVARLPLYDTFFAVT
jgi:hypothetical protein